MSLAIRISFAANICNGSLWYSGLFGGVSFWEVAVDATSKAQTNASQNMSLLYMLMFRWFYIFLQHQQVVF